jgi:Leucine-rich repeat (LRR) protein
VTTEVKRKFKFIFTNLNVAAIIADGMYLNCSVKNLDLSENKITDKGFEYFIDVPLKNNALENLDVSKNMISDLSCKDFILNLEKSSIKKLNFFDNQLRNESGTSLIQSLRANRNIIKVNIKLNRMHTRIIEEIKRLIKINTGNSKMKYIPNLKKEIRQIFVEDNDFAETEKKIHEIYDNGKTVKIFY